MAELVCPIHGPYDASYGTCPYCSGILKPDRPPRPQPLGASEDDMPTALGNSAPAAGWDDEAPTEIGPGRAGRGRFLDLDEEEPTEIGRYAGGDVTELDISSAEAGVLGILWVKEGRRRGRIYKIKDGTIIGRTQGDLALDDPKVSNPHAKFTVEDGQFVLWDFGSKNGTFVNGERIRAATPLKENDTIKIGDMVFVLKVLGE